MPQDREENLKNSRKGEREREKEEKTKKHVKKRDIEITRQMLNFDVEASAALFLTFLPTKHI